MPRITRDNFVGKKFHKLTVTERVKREDGTTGWLCLCECGNTKVYPSSVVRHELNQSCGCYRHVAPKLNHYPKKGKTRDLSGQKFGKLTCVSVSHQDERRKYHWNCECECGNKTVVSANSLIRLTTKSCGCLVSIDRAKENGAFNPEARFGSKEYSAWSDMKKRCLKEGSTGYKNYGGRGIGIHEEWITSFSSFLDHVGPAPSRDHSIDRIDVNGNYEPGNVRWATRIEQARNKTNSIIVSLKDGQELTLAEFCEKNNLHYEWTRTLIHRGITTEEVLKRKAAHLGRLERNKTT